MIVTLTLRYPDNYPQALPEMEIECIEGDLEEEEQNSLVSGMREQVGVALSLDGCTLTLVGSCYCIVVLCRENNSWERR